jgi:thiamine monophosphate kinase
VGISLDASKVPLSSAVRAAWGTNDAAVLRATGAGDDYEIAFTCRPRARIGVLHAAKKAHTKVTLIGRVAKGRGISLMGAGGKKLKSRRKGYAHF